MSIKNLALIILSVSLLGCYSAPQNASTSEKGWYGNVIHASYNIVNKLENNLKQPISQNDLIIVASFVDVSNLTESTPFGRIMAEQVGSSFAQKGYKVIEMKLRQNSIFMQEKKGEFLLSRHIKDISITHKASVVVVGTYAKANDKVYVSARMVNPVDSIIMSSCDDEVYFPEHKEMRDLFDKNN